MTAVSAFKGLPANLPNVANAPLPTTYETAKAALAECSRIDECADWANKAEALASYARMSEDETLRKMADRIQARAIRRCGELLKTYDGRPANAQKQSGGNPTLISQRQAAADAGLSKDQQVTAVRTANVPEDEFERQVDSDNPPTVTALAEQGKKSRPLIDLDGRDPEDFSISTQAQGYLRDLAKFINQTSPETVARGAFPKEHQAIRNNITAIDHWLDRLFVQLKD